MTDRAITVEGLSKRYRLGQLHVNLLSEHLSNLFRGKNRTPPQEFWALQNVSFDLAEGEVLGIIGRNGAGKSTLLKILSRLTSPTRGRATVRGRLTSLLEVGTGFHPELTGRENVYLNATILGMRRREIDRKFDDIVAFSGVEGFIDTPVKRYSSGMYVRLAFAVAAHIEADILLVDEVLAVGDAEFQKRCLGKMSEVARGGRTVIFVSHNLLALRALCTRGLILDKGEVVLSGTAEEAVSAYELRNLGERGRSWNRPAEMPARDLAITEITSRLTGQQPNITLELDVTLVSSGEHKPAFIAVDVLEPGGTAILQAIPRLDGFIDAADRSHLVSVSIELPPLIPGEYLATVWVGSHNTQTLDEVREGVVFEITDSPTEGRTFPHTRDHGYVVPRSRVEKKR